MHAPTCALSLPPRSPARGSASAASPAPTLPACAPRLDRRRSKDLSRSHACSSSSSGASFALLLPRQRLKLAQYLPAAARHGGVWQAERARLALVLPTTVFAGSRQRRQTHMLQPAIPPTCKMHRVPQTTALPSPCKAPGSHQDPRPGHTHSLGVLEPMLLELDCHIALSWAGLQLPSGNTCSQGPV